MTEPARSPTVVERFIAASPASVFECFSTSERWTAWQGTEATIDLRPGGVFRVNVSGDGFVSGTFLEVVADRRIVFTWGWEGPDAAYPVAPGESTVEINLLPEGNGTLLRVRHTIPIDALTELVSMGWQHYVERLAAVAEGADPGPDPNITAATGTETQ